MAQVVSGSYRRARSQVVCSNPVSQVVQEAGGARTRWSKKQVVQEPTNPAGCR